MQRLSSIVTLAAMAATASAQKADWPGFRGARDDGVSLHAKPPVQWSDNENVRWFLARVQGRSSGVTEVGVAKVLVEELGDTSATLRVRVDPSWL